MDIRIVQHRKNGVLAPFEALKQKLVWQRYSRYHFQPLLHVCIAGTSTWDQGDGFTKHAAKEPSLAIVTRGQTCIETANKTYTVQAGQVRICERGQRITEYADTPAGADRLFLIIGGPLADASIQSLGLSESEGITCENPDSIISLFKQIYDLIQVQGKDNSIEISSLLYRGLLEIAKSNKPKHPEPIQQAVEFMSCNYPMRFTLEGLAESVGMKTRTFSRMFKHYLGMSPMKYMEVIRLTIAAELLRSHPWSISQIAAQCGFEDSKYFSARFKKRYGKSPQNYRIGRA